MSSLTLRELGTAARAAEDEGLLELFAACRERVLRVAASPLLADHVAVTTQSGFVELIHTATGEFRLLLTHLDQIPLDSALRCFALVPSLYAAATRLPGLPYPPAHHRHLLYSLAYSNELLLANAETGAVRVFAACESRPSTVACDGDYVVCGEGNGVVSVWRASAEAQQHTWVTRSTATEAAVGPRTEEPFPLLWRGQVFHSTVVALCLHRDRLVCCSADDGAVLVPVEEGGPRSGVPLPLDVGEAAAVVAVFPLTQPPPPRASPLMRPHQSFVACLRTGMIVLSTCPADGGAGGAPTAARESVWDEGVEGWHRRGACEVGRDEVACASCLGPYLAAGTRSGLVLLYACDAVTADVRELVRFHVGYGVVGMQLFGNDTLLVVTAAGDVWRWPLADLLRTSTAGTDAQGGVARGEEEGERDGEEGPAGEPGPLPAPQPCPPPTAAPPPVLNDTLPPEAASAAVAVAEDGDSLVACEGVEGVAGRSGGSGGAGIGGGGDGERTPSAERHARSGRGAAASVQVSTPSVASASPSIDASPDHRSPEGEEAEARTGAFAPRDDATHDTGPSADADISGIEPATVRCMPPPPPPPAPPARVLSSSSASSAADAANKPGAAGHRAGGSRPALFDPDDTHAARGATPGREAGAEAEEELDDETVVLVDVDVMSSVGAASDIDAAGTSVEDRGARASSPSAASSSSLSSSPPPPPASQLDTTAAHHECSAADDEGRPKRSGSDKTRTAAAASKTALDALEVEFAHAMQRLLGTSGAAPAPAEGLRRGRRMSPRKVAGVLANCASQQSMPALETRSPADRNSTRLLEEKRAAVEAGHFDFAEFRAAHRLEVDALPFRHPVRAPAYSLQDRVYGAVDTAGQLCDVAGPAGQDAQASAPALPSAVAADELRDVTYGKVAWTPDPEIAAERRRGGPSMARHWCDELLFPHSSPATAPPASTVLFVEEPLLPSAAWGEVLLLPLPLPPAPSVF